MRTAAISLLTASCLLTALACSTSKPDKAAPAASAKAEKKVRVAKPAMVSAADWGSQPADMSGEIAHTPQYLTVHHAGEIWKPTDEPVKKLRGLQAWGKREKGWPDLPYNFLLAPDGTIYEGRSTAYAPETNTAYDTTGHIGINLWGNFEEQRVSEAQLRSLVNLLAYYSQQHNIPPDTIAAHKDRAQTLCPGRDLYRYVRDGHIAHWVKQVQAGQEPDVQLLPPLPEGPTVMIGQPLPTPAPTPKP